MAEIRPFRAVVYNTNKIKELAGVVCPPYDVIPPARQQYYYGLDPRNFIHILLRKDAPGEDKYIRAGEVFRQWCDDKTFIRDKDPAIYFYSHQYKIKGETKTRLGFISLLRLEEKKSSVFRHEHTRAAPKEDRLKLLRQVKANLSPIFVVFLDKKRLIHYTYQQYIKLKEPFIDLVDGEKNIHRIWRISSPEILENMQAKMRDEDVFIADGHHRYEVSCAYRDEAARRLGKSTGEESFNYILTYFTNTDPRGLSILPIHRMLKEESRPPGKEDGLPVKLKEYFDIEEVREKERFFFLMEKGGSQHLLGMYRNRKFYLLRLKNIKVLKKMIAGEPEEYRLLDISILNHIILKNILGLDLQDQQNIEFNPDSDELIAEADSNPAYTAFFLNPVKIQQIIAVASGGRRMPAKSTYFYPKVPSGLLINRLE